MSATDLDSTVQGVCDKRRGEHPNPLQRVCDKPAVFRYEVRGGWQLLCQEHGGGLSSITEVWNGERWQRP